MKADNTQSGIALLVTLLLTGVLLGVGASILAVTLKQYQLSGVSLASETAFQAANAGMECVLYHDNPKVGLSPLSVPAAGTGRAPTQLNCMGAGSFTDNGNHTISGLGNEVDSKDEQLFRFTWGSPAVCTEISIYKFYNTGAPEPVEIDGVPIRDPCPTGGTCTVVQSRGYNVACSDIGTSARVVEREYLRVY